MQVTSGSYGTCSLLPLTLGVWPWPYLLHVCSDVAAPFGSARYQLLIRRSWVRVPAAAPTRPDLVFLLFLQPRSRPFPGHVCSTFARQSEPSRPARPTHPVNPLPMAIQSVTSTGLRNFSRFAARAGGPATGVWLSPLGEPDHAGHIFGGQGFSRAARLGPGCGAGAG